MNDQGRTRWITSNQVSLTEPEREQAQRVREVENALLSLHFDGHTLPPGAQWQLARYVRGELSRKEAFTDLYGVGAAEQEAQLWARQAPADLRKDSQWPG